MKDMKVADVFEFPAVEISGNYGYGFSVTSTDGSEKGDDDEGVSDCIIHAINNHDRLAEENAELREAFKEVKSIALQQLEFRLEDSECGMCEAEEAKDSLSYKIDQLLVKHK